MASRMPRPSWEEVLRASLKRFLDPVGFPVPLTATELQAAIGCSPQHGYRLLYGYRATDRSGNERKVPGLVTLKVPWVRCVSERRPKRFELTGEGLRIVKHSSRRAPEAAHPPEEPPVTRTRSASLAPGYPFPDLPATAQRRLEFARNLERTGRFQEALATYILLGQDPAVQRSPDVCAYARIRAAGICYLNRELDRALAFTRDARRLLRKRGAPWLQAELANLEGYLLNAFEKYVKSMVHLRRAEAIARGLRNRRLLRAAVHNQAYNLWERGDLAGAEEKFQEALRVAELEKDPRALSAENSTLASFYLWRAGRADSGDLKMALNKAKDYAELSVKTALEAKDPFQATIAYVHLGEVLEAMASSRTSKPSQEQRDAAESYTKALRWALRIRNRKQVADSIGHLAIAYLRLQEGEHAEDAVHRLIEVAALPTLDLTRKWWAGGRVHLRAR